MYIIHDSSSESGLDQVFIIGSGLSSVSGYRFDSKYGSGAGIVHNLAGDLVEIMFLPPI